MSNYDLVVWGATGLTGARIGEYIAETLVRKDPSLKWALAGRSKAKLEAVLAEIRKVVPDADAGIIVADVSNQSSIDAMVSQTKVVIAAAGPFAKVGSPIVEACARLGTSYCDITGESHWVRQMMDKYEAQAKETGAMIVSFCGFDSIPSDIGAYFAAKTLFDKFNVRASQVRGTVYKGTGGGVSGGTLASGINMIDELGALETIRMGSDAYFLNPKDKHFGPDSGNGGSLFYDADLKRAQGAWVMAAVNTRVVRRTQALLGYPFGNFAYSETMTLPNMFVAFVATLIQSLGGLALLFPPFRWFVKQILPAPGTGPDKETCKDPKKSNFIIKHVAKGGGHTVIVSAHYFGDPGYWATCQFAALSGYLMAKKRDQLPGKEGGYLTPVVAFGDVLIDALSDDGVRFSVEKAE